MKNLTASIFASLSLCISAASCAHDGGGVGNGELELVVKVNKKIHVVLTNKAESDKYLMLPLNLVIDDSGSGVEYRVTNSQDKKYELCANVSPLRAMEIGRLGRGEKAEVDYTVGVFAKMYCLDNGIYELQAAYHNIIDHKNKFSINSNRVKIYVPPEAASGRGQLQ